MKSYEIREKFLDFFKQKGHEIIQSDTLVPKNDPSLLFTGAGMNQFKEQFIGKNITYKRAASCQKCLRTGDLENVGRTSGHHTFFEMLGNFSFGDYFKKEACQWGWEFMTKVLGIKEELLWISVYKDDDEACRIWKDIVGIPENRIVKLGAEDNFWPANAPLDGPNGPCGPCSEIFYDFGTQKGCKKIDCNPACDCGRFVEVWNLVFTQFNRVDVNKLEPLPSKNIDTGMGLERMTRVMQGAGTNFETDLFKPVTEELEKLISDKKKSVLNLIADHIRAAIFSICDGVSPSNEERGYVVRKLIRRAYLAGGSDKPFLYMIVPKIVSIMQPAYPEIRDRREDITAVIKDEEERFKNTLESALPKLEELIVQYRKERAIPGEEAFKLVDTYGLPLDVIKERAHRSRYKVDEEKFLKLMDERKNLSRKMSKIEENIFVEGIFTKAPDPPAVDNDPLKAEIAFMAKDKNEVKEAGKGQRVAILTSPQSLKFYTEAGGQVGDTGVLEGKDTSAKILNTYKVEGRVIHDCLIDSGVLRNGDKVTIELDRSRKEHIAKNHTATHLLHSALRKVLGSHVRQSGSLVEDKRFRFDFTHMKKLTPFEISRVEDFVNKRIKESVPLKKEIKTKDVARKEGAMALFGEKYGKEVRVVSIGEFSKELCGGTHVDNTGTIGMFKVISESSIASGVRRIEAVTGDWVGLWLKEDIEDILSQYENSFKMVDSEKDAQDLHKKLEDTIAKLRGIASGKGAATMELVKKYSDDLKPKVIGATDDLIKIRKKMEKRHKRNEAGQIEGQLDKILANSEEYKGIKIIAAVLDNANMNMLRGAADILKKKTKSAFIALGSNAGGRASIIVTYTDDIRGKGLDASYIVKESASVLGGSGGGRKEFAQAGGKDTARLSDALTKAGDIFKERFSG